MLQYGVLTSVIFFWSKLFIFWKKSVVSVFSEMGLFLELTLRGHNLCWERPISKLNDAFSSSLIVLQYGVLRSASFLGSKLSIFWRYLVHVPSSSASWWGATLRPLHGDSLRANWRRERTTWTLPLERCTRRRASTLAASSKGEQLIAVVCMCVWCVYVCVWCVHVCVRVCVCVCVCGVCVCVCVCACVCVCGVCVCVCVCADRQRRCLPVLMYIHIGPYIWRQQLTTVTPECTSSLGCQRAHFLNPKQGRRLEWVYNFV